MADMADPQLYLSLAVAALSGLAMLTWATLNGWRSWLQFKQQQLEAQSGNTFVPGAPPSAGTRIEIADLKERIRKLEAIAAGVDL
jgi:hypothetical protein